MVNKAKRKLEDVTFEEILDASPKLKNLKFPEMEDFRERVEQGDGVAVLQTIRWCCVRQTVIPKWLGKAYWDKAFGTAHPKGAHVEARREKRLPRDSRNSRSSGCSTGWQKIRQRMDCVLSGT